MLLNKKALEKAIFQNAIHIIVKLDNKKYYKNELYY